MIGLSTPTFDLDGSVLLLKTESSDLTSTSRRVTRSATLDGKVSLADMGFSHGDRTLSILAQSITKAKEASVFYLQENYPLLLLTCAEGAFVGTIDGMSRNESELNISFLVKEKLMEV